METYFSVEGVARYLNYSEKAIRKWVLNRQIPYYKIQNGIRFRLSEIEKWVERNKRGDTKRIPEAVAGELFSEAETGGARNGADNARSGEGGETAGTV